MPEPTNPTERRRRATDQGDSQLLRREGDRLMIERLRAIETIGRRVDRLQFQMTIAVSVIGAIFSAFALAIAEFVIHRN